MLLFHIWIRRRIIKYKDKLILFIWLFCTIWSRGLLLLNICTLMYIIESFLYRARIHNWESLYHVINILKRQHCLIAFTLLVMYMVFKTKLHQHIMWNHTRTHKNRCVICDSIWRRHNNKTWKLSTTNTPILVIIFVLSVFSALLKKTWVNLL